MPQPAKKKAAPAKRRPAKATPKKASATTAKKRKPTPPKKAKKVASNDFAGKAVKEFRDALQGGKSGPIDFVILSRERIQEVLDEAVERGRVTADDARSLVQGLIQRGRDETNDVVADLEKLLARGRTRTRKAVGRGEKAATKARKQVERETTKLRKQTIKRVEPALAQVDRVRRRAGAPPAFPILAFDGLTVAQVQSRLGDLSGAELRTVRDYEKRNANRKSVLNSIASKLS